MPVLMGEDYEPYSLQNMKHQIEKHFGDRIIITEINSKSNVLITLPSTASKFFLTFYY